MTDSLDDTIWDDLTSHVRGRAHRDWYQFNCPMCVTRGETPDKRGRGNLKRDHGILINCFNCGYLVRWNPGEKLSFRFQSFMTQIGISDDRVMRLAYRARREEIPVDATPDAKPKSIWRPSFPEVALPDGSRSILDWAADGCDDPKFLKAADYLMSRGRDIANGYTYYWSPSRNRGMNERIIVPFMHENKIVGWSARATSPVTKYRYLTEHPKDFLFNNAAMTAPGRLYVILAEGLFDAIGLDCIGILGAAISAEQVRWINGCGKIPVLVPQLDRRGLRSSVIDIAIANKWNIAFPNLGAEKFWHDDIKDAAAAVARYGRLWTLRSVLKTRETATGKISVKLTRVRTYFRA